MMMQLVYQKDGVVLEARTDMLSRDRRMEWVPPRKFFGEGDAKLYREHVRQKLTVNQVLMLARQYNPRKLYCYDWKRWVEKKQY